MTQLNDNEVDSIKVNPVDFIIGQLNAGDDTAISAHLEQLHAAEIADLLGQIVCFGQVAVSPALMGFSAGAVHDPSDKKRLSE